MGRQGSILVGLLWCVALLSLVVLGVLHTSRMDLMVVRHHNDRIQAHYLALAGIEKARALLYHDARERSRSRQSHTGSLYDGPEQFQDVPFGRGTFRVIRPPGPNEGGGIIYGVRDEESRLNINHASTNELEKLHAMTPDLAAAIVDWLDSDNSVTQGGAEAEYYASLQPPREARNGHALTVRELLMVRGMTRQSLLGDDWHYTGLLEDTTASAGLTAVSDTGWGALLTVSSRVNNVSAGGQERINIQSADESELTGVSGITREIAQAIIAYRNQNRLESIGHLLDVTASRGDGTSLNSGLQGGPSSVPGGSSGGPRVIDESLLLDIADELTAQDETQLSGVINVNTATAEVLMCLPGVTRELAHAIVSYRQSSGFLPNIAYLLRVPGMTRDIFKQLAPRVTARSETFRILSEGTVTSTGVRRRIEVIVHIGLNDTQTLGYREGDL